MPGADGREGACFHGSSSTEPADFRASMSRCAAAASAQRISAADLDLQNSARDQVEQLRRRDAHARDIGDHAAQRGAADRERAALRELQQVDRRRVPRRVAVVHQHPERPHAVERRHEGVLADAVEDGGHPLRHDRLYCRDEIDLAIEYGVIAAVRLRDLRLVLRPDRADDGGAEMLCPLAEDHADAARSGMDQDSVAGLRPEDAVDDERRGESLDQHRRRLLVASPRPAA